MAIPAGAMPPRYVCKCLSFSGQRLLFVPPDPATCLGVRWKFRWQSCLALDARKKLRRTGFSKGFIFPTATTFRMHSLVIERPLGIRACKTSPQGSRRFAQAVSKIAS